MRRSREGIGLNIVVRFPVEIREEKDKEAIEHQEDADPE